MTWALPPLTARAWAGAGAISVVLTAGVCMLSDGASGGLPLVALAVFAGPLVVADARFHLLPNVLLAGCCVAVASGLAMACVVRASLAPLAVGGLWFAAALTVGCLVIWRDIRAVGMGDVKLLAVAGLATGGGTPLTLPWACAWGLAAAGVWSLALLATRRIRRSDAIALGPWLLGATLAVATLAS